MGSLYLEYEFWFAAIQLILAMLGMGATLTLGDFGKVFRFPRAFVFGLLLQVAGVPVIAWLLIDWIHPAAGLAIGLALVAAIPGGTTSNIFTYFASSNVALSISLTAFATVGCLVSTPIVLILLVNEFMPVGFVMPAQQIAIDIGLCLLLPLAIGMVLRAGVFTQAQAEVFAKWCIRGSLLVIVGIVVGSLSAGRLDIEAFGPENAWWVVVFIWLLTMASMLVPVLLRLKADDAGAINIEIVIRNVNLGVLLKASLFPAAVGVADPIGDAVLFTVLLYGALQLLFSVPLIFGFRKIVADMRQASHQASSPA